MVAKISSIVDNANRVDAIIEMYQYNALEQDHLMLSETMEVIHNWYIIGIPTVQRLIELIDVDDISKIYDSAYIDLKIFIKDKIA
jgi:hypothetical protein